MTHYCAAPTVQVIDATCNNENRPDSVFSDWYCQRSTGQEAYTDHYYDHRYANTHHRVLKHNLYLQLIAGAAPTAHLIAELEKIDINPVHVYGLT